MYQQRKCGYASKWILLIQTMAQTVILPAKGYPLQPLSTSKIRIRARAKAWNDNTFPNNLLDMAISKESSADLGKTDKSQEQGDITNICF